MSPAGPAPQGLGKPVEVLPKPMPDLSGWRQARPSKFGWGVYETYDPELVAEMKAAVDADVADCKTCEANPPGSFAPNHYTGHYSITDQRIWGWTYHCRSWSRWYNPKTKQMEGNPHCTCDGCF